MTTEAAVLDVMVDDATAKAEALAKKWARIQEQNREVSEREKEYLALKEEAAAAKKAFEAADALLREMIGREDEPLPLLDAAGQEPAEPEAWRKVGLDTLDLSARTLKALVGAGITTLGELEDYQKPTDLWPEGRPLAETINGFGPACQEDVSDALERFWATHDPAPTAPELAAEPEGGA